jgi:putative flippase GtrA
MNRQSLVSQFFIYAGVGATSTALDWAFFYVLNRLLGVSYLPAMAASFTLGAVSNYVLNKSFTFRDRTRQIIAQLGVYSAVCLFSLLCSGAMMYLLVERQSVPPMPARVLTTGLMLVVNFLMNKFLTYNAAIYRAVKTRS